MACQVLHVPNGSDHSLGPTLLHATMQSWGQMCLQSLLSVFYSLQCRHRLHVTCKGSADFIGVTVSCIHHFGCTSSYHILLNSMPRHRAGSIEVLCQYDKQCYMQGLPRPTHQRSTKRPSMLTRPFRRGCCPWGELGNRAVALPR